MHHVVAFSHKKYTTTYRLQAQIYIHHESSRLCIIYLHVRYKISFPPPDSKRFTIDYQYLALTQTSWI